MGRRAADPSSTPVPLLGEPALVGTRGWRTVANGTSSMAALTLTHHCNIGVQTSPAIQNNQLQLEAKHMDMCSNQSENKVLMPPNGHIPNGAGLKEEGTKDKTRSIINKRRSLETKIKKGVTFEGLESEISEDTKHPIKTSPVAKGVANSKVKSRRNGHYTNGSVVDSEVMGGISSDDVTEGEEPVTGQKHPHSLKETLSSCSAPHRPPMIICSTCGGRQNPAPPALYSQTKTNASPTSAGSLRSSLYPKKDLGILQFCSHTQMERQTERSRMQLDQRNPNLHSSLSVTINRNCPLSVFPAQKTESHLTNHHTLTRKSSADTHIHLYSQTSVPQAHTLAVTVMADGAPSRVLNTNLNTQKPAGQPHVYPPKPPITPHPAHTHKQINTEKAGATEATHTNTSHKNSHLKSSYHSNSDEKRLNHRNKLTPMAKPQKTHTTSLQTTVKQHMFPQTSSKAESSRGLEQNSKPQSVENSSTALICSHTSDQISTDSKSHSNSTASFHLHSNVRCQTPVRGFVHTAVTTSSASNELLSKSDTHAKPSTFLHTNFSIKPQDVTKICADINPESSAGSSPDSHSHLVLLTRTYTHSGPQKTHSEPHSCHHTSIRSDTSPPPNTPSHTNTHKQPSNTSSHTSTHRTNTSSASSHEGSLSYPHPESKSQNDTQLFLHAPNTSAHHRATLTMQTISHQNLTNAFTATQNTKEHSSTSSEVKTASHALCVHSNVPHRQTEPEVLRRSVLNLLSNGTLESSLLAVTSARTFPQVEKHVRTGFKPLSDIESKTQADVKTAEPHPPSISTSQHQHLLLPPNKPPPSMTHRVKNQPPKPSSAPPPAPSFKLIKEGSDAASNPIPLQSPPSPGNFSSQNTPVQHTQNVEQLWNTEAQMEYHSSSISQAVGSVPDKQYFLTHGHPASAVRLLPASPHCSRARDPEQRLEIAEASLQASKDRITTLLNIIQDLEMSHALGKGRQCFHTSQDLSDCSTCQKTACAVYSVEYDFRQQERRFKELLHSLCPRSPERTREEGYKGSLSLLASLIHNHKLHQLTINIMTQSQSEGQPQPQIISQIQSHVQPQIKSHIHVQTRSQIQSQTQARSQIQSQAQAQSEIQSQAQAQIHSDTEILSHIQTQAQYQIQPQFYSQTQIQSNIHPQNQALYKAKIKRKKLCRKLFSWLPRKVHRK